MLISFDNVTFGYLGDPLLENVSFSLHENERVGFVGTNGAGKTTLIKLALSILSPDSGTVLVKSGAKIGYLEQTGGFESEATVYRAMQEVFEEDERLLKQLSELEKSIACADEAALRALSQKHSALLNRIAARDSYHVDVKIKTVLNGMGFQSVYDQPVSTMSGGEKTRLKLCRLLLEEPDLLVLDEPTNHLDVQTLFWLEDYLSGYKGALLVISHDRYFLDAVTNRTFELDHKNLYTYKGNYSAYKNLRRERIEREQREYEKQCEEIRKLQTYIDRNIVRATTAKSAQSRVKQLERIEPLAPPRRPVPPPRFSFTYREQSWERVLTTDAFDLTVGGKTLLKNVSLSLTRGDRCAVIGENGTGKSTLMRYLLSDNPKIHVGRNVTVAYYDQENADLNPEERVIDAYWGGHARLEQTEVRKSLALAGLGEDDVFKKVKELSGGQRARLELSLVQSRHANTLFLDEPTNHLDLTARESLEESLKAFDGTMLFVSHDRRFIEAIANKIICLKNQTLTVFNGDYQSYLKAEKANMPPPEAVKEQPKKTDGYRSKEERAREARTKARLKEIETRISELEAEEQSLNVSLAERAADYLAVKEITERLEQVRSETEALYAEYETLI